MNKLILQAYASLKAGLYDDNSLEKYLCEELQLPENYLSEQYEQIAEAAQDKEAIYHEYMRLLEDLS